MEQSSGGRDSATSEAEHEDEGHCRKPCLSCTSLRQALPRPSLQPLPSAWCLQAVLCRIPTVWGPCACLKRQQVRSPHMALWPVKGRILESVVFAVCYTIAR